MISKALETVEARRLASATRIMGWRLVDQPTCWDPEHEPGQAADVLRELTDHGYTYSMSGASEYATITLYPPDFSEVGYKYTGTGATFQEAIVRACLMTPYRSEYAGDSGADSGVQEGTDQPALQPGSDYDQAPAEAKEEAAQTGSGRGRDSVQGTRA